jgi:D-alanyl-D-alanine carboxypeptidase/D-alanyl-D-alanine-endopeptidase (penicillin-binding protein 4)
MPTVRTSKPRRNPGLILLTAWLLMLGMPVTQAADSDRIASLAGDGGVVLRSPDGEDLISLNPDRPLTPASVLKIPLAHVALDVLGADFRFETHFYRNGQGDLLIRGLGDPFLVSEEIASIAQRLAAQGLSSVRRLVMDDSAFEPNPDLPRETTVRDPYGARNGALAVNFNTVNLDWAANGELISAEPQTPLTPLARELGADLQPGEPQRINVGQNPITGLRQAQQLFRLFLEQADINVTDPDFYHAAVSDDWSLFYNHASSLTLRNNLDGMLRYSNNFIANQVFLTLGARQHGYPATAEAARQVLQERLAVLYGPEFGQDPALLYMREGSGLDRSQRSTAAAMLRILEVFQPHAELLTEVDGVLRKSGTLTGVYNFAGYIPGPDGLYPFVILTNQARNHRGEILQLLQRRVVSNSN